MAALVQDAIFALRGFRRNPGFTAVALLVIALGMGVTTSIFSVVDAVLLRPLPFPGADELVAVGQGRVRGQPGDGSATHGQFIEWRKEIRTVRDLVAYHDTDMVLSGRGEPETIRAVAATANLFELLQVRPRLGRGFARNGGIPIEDRGIVISDRLWRRLGGDSLALGAPVELDGDSYSVVGIASPTFSFPPDDDTVDLWLPAPLDSLEPDPTVRRNHTLKVVGRLMPGVSLQASQAELDSVQSRLLRHDLVYETGRSLTVGSLKAELLRETSGGMVILFLAATFVLLIVCANVANLLLVRATARQGEITVRCALGASRGRIIRQLLTESVLLGVVGGALGLAFAWLTLDALVAILPARLPRGHTVALDLRVLAFTAVVALGAGFAFGVTPALAASSRDIGQALRNTTRAISGGRRRAGLLVGEIALTFVLVTGAALVVQSFSRVVDVDPGFDPDNLLTLPVALPDQRGRNPDDIRAFYQQLRMRLRELPDGRAAIATTPLPFAGGDMTQSFSIPGRPDTQDHPLVTPARSVSPEYFQLMGVRLLRGRTFVAADDVAGAAATSLISESLARRYWAGADPLGQQVKVADKVFEIVGVVSDIKTRLDRPGVAEMYLPFVQRPLPSFAVLVRTTQPGTLAPLIRAQVQSLLPGRPPPQARTIAQLRQSSLGNLRLLALILGLFAALALFLVAVGMYGVISYSVSQRTREFGIRTALGASGQQVRRWVLGQSVRLALLGILIGVVGSLAMARLLRDQLYGISPSDLLTQAGVASLVLVIATLATLVPAHQATHVDPLVALRCE